MRLANIARGFETGVKYNTLYNIVVSEPLLYSYEMRVGFETTVTFLPTRLKTSAVSKPLFRRF
jgi:hypothetical protein